MRGLAARVTCGPVRQAKSLFASKAGFTKPQQHFREPPFPNVIVFSGRVQHGLYELLGKRIVCIC